MKLYRVTATQPNCTLVQYAGSQSEVPKLRREFADQGFKRTEMVVEPVEVPTNKAGLLAFLNTLGV